MVLKFGENKVLMTEIQRRDEANWSQVMKS
jgi:hypothetical protein